jgi:O-phospho-L-seryl-tRNASec:L-selenocysteinyl-tRNA synthase
MFDKEIIKKLNGLGVPLNMINRAQIGSNDLWNPILQLFDHRTIPDQGWNDQQIEMLIMILNSMDSDKDPKGARIGEREGRLATPYLNQLSAGFNHGIGRSGDLSAPQPKAPGASLMQNLTNHIVLSLIQHLGIPNVKGSLVLPFGTGMAIGMALRGLAQLNSLDLRSNYQVLMPRIDHKSPIKGLEFIGCEVLLIPTEFGPNYFAPEGVFCSLEEIEKKYTENPNTIGAIISTTTFFAPRVPDDIKAIAKFAKAHNFIHIVNNAYGVQCPNILHIIRQAIDAGRVDAVIQSTDKNFLTPVGGSIIITPKEEQANAISKVYAGRASASPILQLLVALLSYGKEGYEKLIQAQQENHQLLEQLLNDLANELGEKIIDCQNPVSCAMTFESLSDEQINQLGGFLYNLRVTGPRIVNAHESNYGTCTDVTMPAYIVMNAAIGAQQKDISESINRLKDAINQLYK